MTDLDKSKRQQIIRAIEQVRQKLSWKPGKAEIHLAKRIRLGHLLPTANLADYQSLIEMILNDHQGKLYIFVYRESIYPTVVTKIEERVWLVMFDIKGILETAFPPDNPKHYLSNPAFIYLDCLKNWES